MENDPAAHVTTSVPAAANVEAGTYAPQPQAVAVGAARGGARVAASQSPPPAALAAFGALYGNTAWGSRRAGSADSRPRQERDSLRNRSREGRPGSRKHRRYTSSQLLVRGLRHAMNKCGEDGNEVDPDNLGEHLRVEAAPSAFFRLLELEGSGHALDAWAAAEANRRRSPRTPRTKDAAQLADERMRLVRRAFNDTWRFLQKDDGTQNLLSQLEVALSSAFGGEDDALVNSSPLWLMNWDGVSLSETDGRGPCHELGIQGLTPTQRKVVHQFARVLGLHSESRLIGSSATATRDYAVLEGHEKLLVMRPPRTGQPSGRSWVPPFSVVRVLSMAAMEGGITCTLAPQRSAIGEPVTSSAVDVITEN